MNLSKAPGEIKQLAVYSVVKRVLEQHENIILVIDELPDFAPQQYRTPSKSMIGQAIRKGGAKGIWLWLSGQTMTGVDKQVLKQAMIWILGHQREINEAKRTLDQIPFKTGLKVEDIMTLPVGHFVVCTDEGGYITYVQPEGVDNETARKVSLGEVSVNEVVEMLKKGKKEDDDDLIYKEKYEEEKRKREEYEKTITQLKDEKATLETELKRVEALKAFGAALENFLIEIGAGIAIPSPQTTIIDLEHRDLVVNIHHEGKKEVKMSTSTKEGQMMYCIVNEMPRENEGWAQIDLIKKLLEHGWSIKQSTVSVTLSKWAAEGLLIKTERGYRLPLKVKFNIKKEE
jgi:hypothetical protein